MMLIIIDNYAHATDMISITIDKYIRHQLVKDNCVGHQLAKYYYVGHQLDIDNYRYLIIFA